MSISLASKIGTAFGAALLLMGVMSVMSYQGLNDSLAAADRVRYTEQVLSKIRRITSQVTAAESGIRGFLLTGNEQYLEPYQAAYPVIAQESQRLRELTTQTPAHQERLDALEPLLAQRLAVLGRTIDLARSQPPKAPQQTALVREGSELTETIRGLLGAMENDEEEALQQRTAAAQASARKATWIILVGNGVAVLLLSFAGAVIYGDLVARRRAEEALRQERDFAENLIEAAPAVVLVLDREGRIVRFNPYLEELAGYRLAELRGQDWFGTCVPEREQARLRGLFQQAVRGSTLPGVVYPIATKGGWEREVEWFTKKLTDDQGNCQALLCLGHDITALKQTQERALQTERLAAIGQMVSGLAHESRNALQRSRSCLHMLAWQVPDRPKAQELVDRLQTALDHLLHLYEEVRNYAEPLRLNLQRCHLGELVDEAWAQLEKLRQGRHAALHLVPTTLDLSCAVDRPGLRQVLRGLLANALAACPDPVAIDVAWSEVVVDGQPGLQLAIRDNGPGLPVEDRAKVFEPFYTTKTHGTGLGLALARRIVEAHHGRIALSDHGRPGAEFLIALPREQAELTATSRPSAAMETVH